MCFDRIPTRKDSPAVTSWVNNISYLDALAVVFPARVKVCLREMIM